MCITGNSAEFLDRLVDGVRLSGVGVMLAAEEAEVGDALQAELAALPALRRGMPSALFPSCNESERAIKVRSEVAHIFDAHRKPDHVRGHSGTGLLLGGKLLMRG